MAVSKVLTLPSKLKGNLGVVSKFKGKVALRANVNSNIEI